MCGNERMATDCWGLSFSAQPREAQRGSRGASQQPIIKVEDIGLRRHENGRMVKSGRKRRMDRASRLSATDGEAERLGNRWHAPPGIHGCRAAGIPSNEGQSQLERLERYNPG